jgi:hypothetical protein
MWNRRIFAALVVVTAGCPLDPKNVGQGSATEGESESETGSDSSGGSSESSISVSSSDSGSEDPSTTASSNETGECMHEGCPWEPCAGAACGTFCNLCAPWDTDCGEPGTYTVCTDSGVCEVWPEWDIDACPGQGVQPGFETSLDQVGGCSDMVAYATDADVTTAIHVRVDGLVAEAHMAGGPIMHEYAGDDPVLDVEVTFGSDLLAETCNDAVSSEPMVSEHWVPGAPRSGDAGTITIVVTPDLDSPPNATATITFENVTLQRHDANIFDPDLVIESFAITDASVGWLPG